MSKIKSFSKFNQKIFEGPNIDLSDTYLQSNYSSSSTINKEKSLARKKFGKVFKSSETTEGKSWGLKFEGGSKEDSSSFKVVFPPEFRQNFKTMIEIVNKKIDEYVEKQGILPSNSSKSKDSKSPDRNDMIRRNQKTDKFLGKSYGKANPIELLRTTPSEYWKFIDFGITNAYGEEFSFKDSKKQLDFSLLDNIFIDKESITNFNRTHFPSYRSVPNDFKGIALGYIIYEEFIKFLGFASSKSNASSEAQRVWYKIAKDPDFYTIVSSNNVFVIHKEAKIPNLDNIVKDYLNDLKSNKVTKIKYDKEILEKCPTLKGADFLPPVTIEFFDTIIRGIEMGNITDEANIKQIESFENDLLASADSFSEILKGLEKNFNDIIITPQIKSAIFSRSTDEFFRENSDIKRPIFYIGLLSLLKESTLDKLKDNFSSDFFKFLKVSKMFLTPILSGPDQSKVIGEVYDILKKDVELFNNSKFTTLFAIFLPEVVRDVYIDLKKAGENVSSWDKIANAIILRTIIEAGDRVNTTTSEFYKYIREENPNLKEFDNSVLGNDDRDVALRNLNMQLNEVNEEIYDILFDLPAVIQAKLTAIAVGKLEANNDEDYKDFFEKFKLKELFEKTEFKKGFFGYSIDSDFLYQILKNDFITVTDYLEFTDKSSLRASFDYNSKNRAIVIASVEKLVKSKNQSKIDELIEFLKKNDLIIRMEESYGYLGDKTTEEWKSWFFDIEVSTLGKMFSADLIHHRTVVYIYKKCEQKNDELVEYLLKNFDEEVFLGDLKKISTKKLITKILKFQFETKKDSRYRIEYFGEQYPQDTNDDLVEWHVKNREYIKDNDMPSAFIISMLTSKNKKMTLTKFDKKAIDATSQALEEYYNQTNKIIFSKDADVNIKIHFEDVFVENSHKFEEFTSEKNVVDFYTVFLPYINDTGLKNAIVQYIKSPLNEKRILNYKTFRQLYS